MKTNKIYILGLLIALLGTISCKNEVEDIFDDSAANRITKAMAENKEVFCGATNGWEMQYFANDGEQGYIFLMKFNEDGSVKVATKNKYSNSNKYSEYTSLYQMIADNGPVVTFNSYNPLFHVFSDPQDIPDTSTDETGRGHEGDYEFVVMSATANEVILRGKKRKLTIIMRPLAADQSWEDYFTKLDAMETRLFSTKIPTLYLTSQNITYSVSGAPTHKISYYPSDGDPVTQTENAVFLLTADGTLRFCHPIDSLVVDGKKTYIQEFKISDGDALISTEGQSAKIVAPAPALLVTNTAMKWRIDETQLGGQYATVYANVVSESMSALKKVFQYFQFDYDAKEGSRTLSFKNGTYNGMFYMDIVNDNGNIAITYKDKCDSNGKIHLDKCPSYKSFLDLLGSTEYSLEGSSLLCPTSVKFVSKANASDTFVAKIQ